MEHLSMSRKERTRLEVFSRVKAGQISKVKAAALLGLSYRQTLRAYRRYAKRGAAGLVHGLRGKASNHRRDSSQRRAVLAAYRQRYAGFGPTLATEQMAARAMAWRRSITRRCGAGCWTRGCGAGHANARRTAAGASARRTRGSWCSSTARRTTGWRDAGRGG